MSWKNRSRCSTKLPVNNRLNFIAAIIFLLTAGLIARLFILQIKEHDNFVKAAADQQEIYAEIEPARGKIFVQDKNNQLYPIATNKQYAQIFAVPQEAENPQRLTETLYAFFKQTAVEKEVDGLLKLQADDRLNQELAWVAQLPVEMQAGKKQEVAEQHKLFLQDPGYLESKNLKRQEMIKERRQAIIDEYLKILEKNNDPYEPLEKKVEVELAKQFHLALISDDWQSSSIKPEDLEIKNNEVYYLPDQKVLKFPGVGYFLDNYRYYLEGNIGAQMLGFTSLERETKNGLYGRHGQYGLEGFFDEELFGSYGSLQGERGAGGLMIMSNRQYEDKVNGDDLVLTIDHSAQFFACQRLNELAEHYAADSGSVIIMDPQTGAILVMCSYPDFDPNNYNEVENIKVYNNPALFDQYEPGSVFKAITMAAALNENKVTPATVYDDKGQIMIKGWPKPIKNSDFGNYPKGHGSTTMVQVLEKSLNLGAIFAMEQTDAVVFADYVKKFGFGEKTGLELEGEEAGDIRSLTAKKIKEISAATAAFGQGITVTPLQLITAYAAIANGGELVKPYLVKQIIHADGSKMDIKPDKLQRVISQQTAAVLSSMLANAVAKGSGKLAQVPGYFIAGKTGTGQIADKYKAGYYENQFNHTFVGFAPAAGARFVILTKFSNPKGYKFAESTAVPLAHDIIEFLLNYWEVPQEKRTD